MVVSQKTCIAVYASRKATASAYPTKARRCRDTYWLQFTPCGSYLLLLDPSERSSLSTERLQETASAVSLDVCLVKTGSFERPALCPVLGISPREL